MTRNYSGPATAHDETQQLELIWAKAGDSAPSSSFIGKANLQLLLVEWAAGVLVAVGHARIAADYDDMINATAPKEIWLEARPRSADGD
ncbi:hypothetical protein [Bradyrhizobium sp.]|jgi:hypothetical protein|uniref:hypothetical protein n=1 Tax=Bradyrhizobium sp. TaxID=376 RepID=UPI003C24A860